MMSSVKFMLTVSNKELFPSIKDFYGNLFKKTSAVKVCWLFAETEMKFLHM